MSQDRPGRVRIGARSVPDQLAEAVGVDVEEVRAAARELGLGDDALDGRDLRRLGAALGFDLEVEPRDLALEALYQWDTTGVLDLEGAPQRVADLVNGVIDRLDSLDEGIEEVSSHWSVARMPAVDRCVLRLAAFELTQETEPIAVVLSEAVRLAAVYSTEKSAAFVNGLLSSLARRA